MVDLKNSSLDMNVKIYHRDIIEPIIGNLDDYKDIIDLLDSLITKENIGSQSVKYAETAGSVEWDDIKNIPSDIGSGDGSGHTHKNKDILDSMSSNDITILNALKEEYEQWKLSTKNPSLTVPEFIEQLCNPQYWGTF